MTKTKLVFSILTVFVPCIILFYYDGYKDSQAREALRLQLAESIPFQTPEEIKIRLSEIESIRDLGITDPKKFISLFEELEMTELFCETTVTKLSTQDALDTHGGRSVGLNRDSWVSYRISSLRAGSILNTLYRAVPNEVLASPEMRRLQDSYRSIRIDMGPQMDRGYAGWAFLMAYLIAIVLSRQYIHRVIRGKGGKVWLAMASSFRYWYFQICWPHLLVREYNFDPRRQLRQALKFASVTLSTLISVVSAAGQAKKPKPEERVRGSEPITWAIDQQFQPRYHGLNGGEFHSSPVVQTSITASTGSCFANFWHSAGFDDLSLSSNFGDEFDLSAGCSKSFGKATINGGLLLFNIVPLQKLPRGDLMQPDFRTSYKIWESETHTLAPFVWVRYAFPLGKGPKAGLFVHYGANHNWQIAPRLSLSHNTELLHDVNGAFGFDKAWVAAWYGQMRFRLTKKLKLIVPSFRLSTPITDVQDGRKTHVTIGVGWAYSF